MSVTPILMKINSRRYIFFNTRTDFTDYTDFFSTKNHAGNIARVVLCGASPIRLANQNL